MREELKRVMIDALNKIGILKTEQEISLEIPKNSDHGDYSSNIAMQLAKTLQTNPEEIAKKIKESIKWDQIDHIEVVRPGFLNFYLKSDYLFQNINRILKENDQYGSSLLGTGTKVNLEYVSANPTGILHLGHARGASYGDSLARILTFAGYDVIREYYINDAGNQIVNLSESIEQRYQGLCGKEEHMPENGYYGKEIIDIAVSIFDEYGSSVQPEIFKERGLDYLLKQIKQDLADFHVEFDVWTSETEIYSRGLVTETLHKLKESGNTYLKDDALWLKTTLTGDEKDRVLVKSDQTNTYFLPDIAYHLDKYQRHFDLLIDVFGADHHGYIPRLKGAIQLMGEDPEKLDVEIVQMVRLVRGKEEIKMSKRTGNAVTIQELVDEVGLSATRYFFAMRSLDTQMDFDLDLARKNSNENPVFYVEYAHARICSILAEYGKEVQQMNEYVTLSSPYITPLLTKLYEFQDTIELCSIKRAPHMLTNYVYELASLFHTFYAHEHVLSEDKQSTEERISLIAATAIVIRKSLELIGIVARTKM